MNFKAHLLVLGTTLMLLSGCATLGDSPNHNLPGRHAYSIETRAGHGWIEFDCERYKHPNPKIGWATRVRTFYSQQRSFALNLERKDGSRQLLRLPGCEDVESDGQFPEMFFASVKNWQDQPCASPEAESFLRSDNRNYRCWGSLDQTGYVAEYFYLSQ